jgi:hypothetical protein
MLITTDAATDTITFTVTGAQNTFSNIAVSGLSTVVADSASDTLTLIPGTGITLTTNATNDSITITNSSPNTNSFSTVAVSGQSSVVADSTADTLTLVAGTGISITTNSTTDTITITSTVTGGGGGSGDTGNVVFSTNTITTSDTNTYPDIDFLVPITVPSITTTDPGTPEIFSATDIRLTVGADLIITTNDAITDRVSRFYANGGFQLPILSAAPTPSTVGIMYIADGSSWNPASKIGGRPYPVFWDGASFNALY